MSVTRLVKIGPEHGGNFEFEWDCPHLQAHLISDVGKKREHNEDSCVLSVPEDAASTGRSDMLFAVADGMGGASAGEHASHLTCKTVAETLFSNGGTTVPERLRRAIDAANKHVFDEARKNPDYRGMGTTASLVTITGNMAYILQVGDSRVYVARNKVGLHQITDDHSVVAEQVRNGFLTEEEARTHCLKNLITRAVGIREEVEADLFSVRLKRDDTLLICSDGLCNMIGDAEIAETLGLRSLRAAAHRLVGRALEEGGTDNITCALARLTANPPRVSIDKDATRVPIPSPGFWRRLGFGKPR